jgi:hypothetical protein
MLGLKNKARMGAEGQKMHLGNVDRLLWRGHCRLQPLAKMSLPRDGQWRYHEPGFGNRGPGGAVPR